MKYKIWWQVFILFSLPHFGISQSLKLDPVNPHYLNFHGKPLLLVSSAEPYGAVVNKKFDYKKYLNTLHDEGMNYTRIFSGSYIEVPGSFGVSSESLIPDPGSYLAPWKRSNEPGLYEGEGKFDFNQWEPEYFIRLKDFVRAAASLNIIVEMTFFCATYEDSYWIRHPFNDHNNINNLEPSERLAFNMLKNEKVVHYQKELIKKLTVELNSFDNIFFEISNEPWSDYQEKVTYLHKSLIPPEKHQGVLWARAAPKETLAWQKELAKVFRETENQLPKRHLLAQNYSDMLESLTHVDDNIDILNFHYAWPEEVTVNYGWNRPINNDETGFAGIADSTYLKQAWTFMLNGGAIFNNLDYSFYAGKEDGTGTANRQNGEASPGGGSKDLRHQLRFLREFLEQFNFIEMKPSASLVFHAPGLEYYCLANAGKEYALYFDGRNQGYFMINLPSGNYKVSAYSPVTGKVLESYTLKSSGGTTKIEMLALDHIAIAIVGYQK